MSFDYSQAGSPFRCYHFLFFFSAHSEDPLKVHKSLDREGSSLYTIVL
jgi:hypothetical protein